MHVAAIKVALHSSRSSRALVLRLPLPLPLLPPLLLLNNKQHGAMHDLYGATRGSAPQ